MSIYTTITTRCLAQPDKTCRDAVLRRIAAERNRRKIESGKIPRSQVLGGDHA